MSEETKPLPENRVEFFINELARMEQDEIRRYKQLSVRLATVEQKGKSSADGPEQMLGSLFLVLVVIQVLPLLIDMVRSWKADSVSSQL